MRGHGNGCRHATNLGSLLIVCIDRWNSFHGLAHCLLLELAHLDINLSLSLLIDCSMNSQLNLLLDVRLDKFHLLTITAEFVLRYNWWCSIFRLHFSWLIVSTSRHRSNFILFDDCKGRCFFHHHRHFFFHHQRHLFIHTTFSVHHAFCIIFKSLHSLFLFNLFHHCSSLFFAVNLIPLLWIICFEVCLMNPFVISFAYIKSKSSDEGSNEFTKSVTTNLTIDREHVIQINVKICFSNWI